MVKGLTTDIFDILDLGGKIFKNREVLRYALVRPPWGKRNPMIVVPSIPSK